MSGFAGQVAARRPVRSPAIVPRGPGHCPRAGPDAEQRSAAASPARTSHSKSQRRPVSGDAQRRQATVKPGQLPTERHGATPSDAREVTAGQGVAGSNPAVPTGQSLISNAATGLRVADGSAPRSHQSDETAVVRRVRGHNATGQQGLPSPPKVSSPPGRTCLRVEGRRFTSAGQAGLAAPGGSPGRRPATWPRSPPGLLTARARRRGWGRAVGVVAQGAFCLPGADRAG